MREFFRGWRRKAGCVTLVLTCTFTSLWVRRFLITEEITVCCMGLVSGDGILERSDFLFYGSVSHTDHRRVYWRVPYSIVVLPLTLPSAYLLLWKPRKRKAESDA